MDLVEVVFSEFDGNRVVIEVSASTWRDGVNRQRGIEGQIVAVRNIGELKTIAMSGLEVLEDGLCVFANDRNRVERADLSDVPLDRHTVGAFEGDLGDGRLSRLLTRARNDRRIRAAHRTSATSDDNSKSQ